MEDVDEQPVVMPTYRDGKEYHSVRFSFDLPPGYQTAWIVALSMAHNDLLRAWRQLAPLVNSTDPVDEGDYVYFARLACSHAYEVTDRLIRRGLKHRLIRPLFSLLGPQENRALKLIQKLALPRGGSWVDRTLAPIRNNFSHYNIAAVRSALDAIHRNEPGLVSWYSVGQDWTGDRFFYADEVSGRMVGKSPGPHHGLGPPRLVLRQLPDQVAALGLRIGDGLAIATAYPHSLLMRQVG